MNAENAYLLYTHYDITEQDDISQIVKKVSLMSYLTFCRKFSFPNSVSAKERDSLMNNTTILLSDRIPKLLQSANDAVNGKEVFDKMHHEICEDMRQIYNRAGGQPYGIVQRWLNFTLMQLVVIESNLMSSKIPVTETRRYFHVPVDQHLLLVATQKRTKYLHGLRLKCAPLFREDGGSYQMEWFKAGEVKPCEQWEYPEYLEFQIAVQDKIAEIERNPESDFHYQDVLGWVFAASMEKKRIRYYVP